MPMNPSGLQGRPACHRRPAAAGPADRLVRLLEARSQPAKLRRLQLATNASRRTLIALPGLVSLAAGCSSSRAEVLGPGGPVLVGGGTSSSDSSSSSGPRAEQGSNIASAELCIDRSVSASAPLNTFQAPDRSFTLLWPCGWSAVQNLDTDIGVLASFYNPQQPGVETAAVFASRTDAVRTEDLGTAESVGMELASVAPFGELLDHSSFTADGLTYYFARVMFGGSTAGMFGAVMECRCVVVRGGKKYTMRVTTTRYRWLAYPEVRDIVTEVTKSFRLVASGV